MTSTTTPTKTTMITTTPMTEAMAAFTATATPVEATT